jgi:tight adherence protein C
MLWIIWITVFTSFFLFARGFIAVWDRRQRVKVRVGNPGPGSASPLLRHQPKQPSGLKEWTIDKLIFAGQWALPDMNKITEMRKDLIKAGYRHPQAPAIYLSLRIIMAFAFAFPVLLYSIIRGNLNPATLTFAFLLAFLGFFLVSLILGIKIRRRQDNLDRALPDIIDLFVICMEAGLSLNAALQRVAEETRKSYRDFSEELQITNGDLRAGLPWDEAFDNLGKRTDVQSIRSMVGLMIQSNKLGASISEALRHHADFIRTQRILVAEEKVGKLAVKMIFPLVFFIMPAIIIVAVGPGILHIIEMFTMKVGPSMGGGLSP